MATRNWKKIKMEHELLNQRIRKLQEQHHTEVDKIKDIYDKKIDILAKRQRRILS